MNHEGVIFYCNNFMLHTTIITCQQILTLGWEVTPHLDKVFR